MHYLRKILIEGFWGDKTVTFDLNHSENFLIGVNGSGKTTIINLVAAVVTVDFKTIDRIQFDKISLVFGNKFDKRKRPKIEVSKDFDKHSPFKRIKYKLQISSKKKPLEIYLDDLEEEMLYRRNIEDIRYGYRYNHMFNEINDLQAQLDKLISVGWLSIHRFKSGPRRRGEERNFDSLVDQKLSELSDNLIKYLSQLKNQADLETNKFQKFIFLSLIREERLDSLYHVLNRIDLNKEKQALHEIYQLFELKDSEYQKRLNKFFNEYSRASKEVQEKNKLSFKEAGLLIGLRRIHSVVEEWNKLLAKQELIYSYRNTFSEIVNSLLQRKSLYINEKNELKVKTQSGKELNIKDLSSGEKQLVIIMCETLLQQSKPHIFIADEPELSLHIQWQEKLVDSLKALNPNCQIIFATHSPDIVSHFSESVIEIEEHIS